MRANPEIDTLRPNRPIQRITCTLVLALLGATTALLPASAQEATPAPIICDVPPRPVTFIADLIAAPEPELTQTTWNRSVLLPCSVPLPACCLAADLAA